MNILIAEDNQTSRADLRLMLERAGFSVVEAADGNEAWQTVNAGRVDAVVTDVLMPGLDGFQLCHRIRSNPRFEKLPVVFYTDTYATVADESRARSLGAEKLFRKPDDLAQVATALRAALALNAPQALPATGSGDAGSMQQYDSALVGRLERHSLDLERQSGELGKSNRQLQQILDNLFSLVGLVSPEGVLLEINRAPLEAAGLQRVDVVGRPFAETFWWAGVAEVQQQLRAALQQAAQGERVRFDVQIRKSAEQFIAIDFACGPIRGADGRIIQLVATAVDITERKRLEEQFLRSQRMELIGTLAGGIAHDMNNLLAAMMMASGLLRERLTEPRDRQMVKMIESSAQRGAGVLRQLLTFSRGLGGERVPVQARHLVEDIITLITETFPSNIAIAHKVPKGLWAVRADPTQLHQVLMNLCVNARDAMPEGGKLQVNVENIRFGAEAPPPDGIKPGPFVALSVVDTGTGIPPENLAKIFDAFFTTKDTGKGTGLGLASVRGIVNDHGGWVAVESAVGKGSTFRVHFPAVEDMVEAETAGDQGALPYGQGETILLVDDEDVVREAASGLLEAHNYRVVRAANGREGLERFLQHHESVRLVLTDMMMPVMDGRGLVRSLRIVDPKVRVLIICGSPEKGEQPDFSSLEPVEVLWKPCEASLLIKTVHRMLTLG